MDNALLGPHAGGVTLASFLQMYKVASTVSGSKNGESPSTNNETAKAIVMSNNGKLDECPVCLAPLSAPYAQLRSCQNKLHVHCLAQVATLKHACPTCRGSLVSTHNAKG